MDKKEFTDLVNEIVGQDRNYWVNTYSNAVAIPFTCFGDYDNSCAVERANSIAILREFKRTSSVFKTTGIYGSSAVLVDVEKASEKTLGRLAEIICMLTDYPVVDDMVYSKLERQMILGGWEFYKDDIPYGLKTKAYDLLKADYSNYAHVESGGNVYIDCERLVKDLQK